MPSPSFHDETTKRFDQISLLRFITCGSVDDGKSTLLGRLLHECKAISDDQLAGLAFDSKRFGTQGGELDYSLLLDGLASEREQGITIDVAYRYFSTARRRFIAADTPGHEQYTRNMVTGASTADAAVILVDARKGILVQTRRHTYLLRLMGIRHVVLAINKMDLVDYAADVFEKIVTDFSATCERLGGFSITAIPMSALQGDCITSLSPRMPWYRGPSLMQWLDSIEPEVDQPLRGFRMPVQWVNRPHQDFRGFAGLITSGRIRAGDRVRVLPTGREASVSRIVTSDGDLSEAEAGQSITVTLQQEVDVSRGDVFAAPDDLPDVADQFETTIVWMCEEPLLPGRSYLVKLGAQVVSATVSRLKYTVNVNTLEHGAATTLILNDIGVCNLTSDQPVVFDPYDKNRDGGSFIIIDRITNSTVGAGLIHFALRRSKNIPWHRTDLNKMIRASLKGQRPCVLWFTGLSGSGKSTIANSVETQLYARGYHTYILDGDNLRHGLNKDLGFTMADRIENIRRIGEVAKLMVDAGLIVLAAFISPFRAERQFARDLFEANEFLEVFVDTPLSLAENRDPKGLYKKARRGELQNFTGIDSPYEEPTSPELRIETAKLSVEMATNTIFRLLLDRQIINGH